MRAGLDYRERATVAEYDSLDECLRMLEPRRLFALSTKGSKSFFAESFAIGDAFLLGPETRGLPDLVLDSTRLDNVLRIPMRKENRSLNLSNAAAIVVYEAWRQLGFPEGD